MKVFPVLLLILFPVLGFAKVNGPSLAVSVSVVIRAPVADVWTYVGNNGNARNWSVYFDHITTLSGRDGTVGSVRRCFRYRDERPVFWDERTDVVEPGKLRVLDVYNLHGFKPEWMDPWLSFKTKQIYESLGPDLTRLTFEAERVDHPGLAGDAAFFAGFFRTERLFRKNLANIKAALEEKENYKRVYAWRP